MTATATMYVYTSTDAGTENESTYLNLMSTDAEDTDDNDYQSARITIPSSGSTFSYERWFRVKFTDTFNLIENCSKCFNCFIKELNSQSKEEKKQ